MAVATPGKKIDDRHIRLEYMGGRCTVCRRGIKAVEKRYLTSKGAFEFNHIDPAQKSAIHEKMIRRIVSTEQFDELDKCNLLCRKCHAVWTNQRLRGKIRFSFTLPDVRVVTRRFGVHGMLEIKDGKPHPYLFADNPQHLQPYAYSLGTGRQIFRAGCELEKSLTKLMLATRRRKFLRIWDQKALVFQVVRLDASFLRFEQSVRFDLLKFAGAVVEKTLPHLWVRNGKAIVKGQGVKKIGDLKCEVEYAAIERALAGKRRHGSPR